MTATQCDAKVAGVVAVIGPPAPPFSLCIGPGACHSRPGVQPHCQLPLPATASCTRHMGTWHSSGIRVAGMEGGAHYVSLTLARPPPRQSQAWRRTPYSCRLWSGKPARAVQQRHECMQERGTQVDGEGRKTRGTHFVAYCHSAEQVQHEAAPQPLPPCVTHRSVMHGCTGGRMIKCDITRRPHTSVQGGLPGSSAPTYRSDQIRQITVQQLQQQ